MDAGFSHEGLHLLMPIVANETLYDEILALHEVDFETTRPEYVNTFKLIAAFLEKYMQSCKEVVTRIDLFVCDEEKKVFELMKDELIGFLMNMHEVMRGAEVPDYISAITETKVGLILTEFINDYDTHIENLKKPLFDQALFRIHRFFYIFNTQRRFHQITDGMININPDPFRFK